MIIIWGIVMIFKMSYSVFVLFTGIEPTQAPPFIPHLRGGSLLAGKDKYQQPEKFRYRHENEIKQGYVYAFSNMKQEDGEDAAKKMIIAT